MNSIGFGDLPLPAAFGHQANMSVTDLADRQIRRWMLAQRGQSPASTFDVQKATSIGPYLTISRESGIGASTIARFVGESVGWDVFDRELLECVAERYHTSLEVLESVDETPSSWISEILDHLIVPGSVSQSQYVHRVGRAILTAARAGKAIFVGRGAQFLLPRQDGLQIRLIASLGYRIKQIMERAGLSHDKAHDYVVKTDCGRKEYVHRYFQRDIANPRLYDLTVDIEKFRPARAAQLIVDALKSCFDSQITKKQAKDPHDL